LKKVVAREIGFPILIKPAGEVERECVVESEEV
jgi:hypothetical protein